MNLKISISEHKYLLNKPHHKFLFGSRLHRIHKDDSDYDYICMVPDYALEFENIYCEFLPNVHSWQFDGKENNTQYVWMLESQFFKNLMSGDGNMLADVVILNKHFHDIFDHINVEFYTRTYKVIKGYLGVAKRDLKMHGHIDKKRFHAKRSLMMAKLLMDGITPNEQHIIDCYREPLEDKDTLLQLEVDYRNRLNEMLNNGDVDMYPKFIDPNPLLQTLINSNNIREFKY